jgi:hypothetical protein
MPEAVRLVIWDLDDTFWKRTLTKGDITAYVQAHHDCVIELARRGIVSFLKKRTKRLLLPVPTATCQPWPVTWRWRRHKSLLLLFFRKEDLP